MCAPSLLAQEFAFVNSLAKGTEQVAQSGKLLIVVQTTGDFTQHTFSLPAAKTFELLTLCDPLVAKASQTRCVFVCQAIGSPFITDDITRAKQPELRLPDNVVTYFCSPQGLVLHYVVGVTGAEDLLAALDWSERVYRELSLHPESQNSHTSLTAWHRLRIADAHAVAKLPKAKPTQSESDIYVRALVAAAWEIRGQQLLARFGDNFTAEKRSALLAELAAHGEPRTDFPHLVLARYPFIPIERLQRSIAEICLQSEFWEISPRRAEIAAWESDRRRQGKTVLLVIHPNSESTQLNQRKVTETTWRAQSEQLKPLVNQAAIADITVSELATLARDKHLDVHSLATRHLPRYVLVDGSGAIAAVLDEKGDESDLARILSRMVNSRFVAGSDIKPRAIPEVNR